MGEEDSEEIDKRSKVKITDDMFEAAKLMKKGVSHIKDLDYSLVKRDKSLVSQTVGTCEVTIIDIFTGEVKMAKVSKPVGSISIARTISVQMLTLYKLLEKLGTGF